VGFPRCAFFSFGWVGEAFGDANDSHLRLLGVACCGWLANANDSH